MSSYKIHTLLLWVLITISTSFVHAQKVALKTNLLYGAYTSTPNIGIEFGLNNRSTFDIGAGFNWLNYRSSNNKKIIHWLGEAEYRYWTCRKFNGHFFGVHALGTQYNISGQELPLLFGKHSKEHRYEGWGAGAGISYGYSFYLGTHWSLEASLGVGYAYLKYNKYKCEKCGEKLNTESRNYLGPTRAALSIIYIIK